MVTSVLDVVETKLRNPCATLQQIADKYKVTRERIRQILEPYNLPTGNSMRAYKPRVCPECGHKITNSKSKRCGKCYLKEHRVTLACDMCGKLFTRHLSEVIYQENAPAEKRPNGKPRRNWFCSRHCLGVWRGKHYGFRAHPENTGRRPA